MSSVVRTPQDFFGTFEDAIVRLKRNVKLRTPVKIVRRKIAKNAGTCSLNKNRSEYILTIDSRLSEDAAILVLIHEYAHALDWDIEGGKKNKRKKGAGNKKKETEKWDHSETWGDHYATCLRVFDLVD